MKFNHQLTKCKSADLALRQNFGRENRGEMGGYVVTLERMATLLQ